VSAGVAVAVVACTVATWIPGVPLALLALRRTSAGLAVVLVTAAGLGLGVWMAVGLPAVHQGWFRPPPLVAAATLVGIVAWIPARHQVGRLRPGRPGWLAAVLAVLAVVAVALRDAPVYFAYQVADFGEYVNRGNVIADGGPFGGWFVNGFPLVLGEANLLLGESRSTHVMPFLGLLVGATVLAALHLAGIGRVVVAVAAVPFAAHVHAVWFSQFPASETLYAALLGTSMLLAVAALAGRDHVAAGLGGAFGFLLVASRGNGLVYLPVAAVGLALVSLLTDEERAPVLRTHLLVLAAGLWAGSVYDARHNARYFLDAQAVPRLPGPVADLFGRVDELPIAALLTVVVVAGLAAAVGVGVLVGRAGARGRRRLRLGTLAVVAAAVVAAHLVVFPPASFLPRYEALGAPVWVAAGLALAVWLADAPRDGVTRFLVGWPFLVGVLMATFQVTRMRKSMTVDSQWFLYWDRYFFSEAFPMLLLAGAAAGGVAVAHAATGPRGRRVLGVAGLALVAAFVVDLVPPVRRAGEQAMFAGTYEELSAIDELMPEPLPVVYDGLVEQPDGWFWGNSSRVLADPLSETFGRHILNASPPLGPDARPATSEVRRLLAGAGAGHGYLLQVRPSREWGSLHPRLEPEVLGEVVVPIERLEGRSAVRPEDQAWITSTVHVRVVHVAAGASPDADPDGDGPRSDP
jgi:hypothetical protein